MPSKWGKRQTYSRIKRTDIIINKPQCYDCPEKHPHIYILGKHYQIPVLLDSVSNIFLINEQLVKDLQISYHFRADAVQIQGFTGEAISSGGSHFTKSLYLEIGTNKHLSLVSCEIAPAEKYGMIIPFGWWHQQHPIKNIANPDTWCFDDTDCISKKNQFALFAFQRTLHLLAAFCGTIFLKLCNQKTHFILRLI